MDFAAARSMTFSTEHPAERSLLKTMLGFIALFVFLYLYFVSASVLNVIARKEAISGVKSAQSSISTKEQEYFSLTESITPEEAARLGLAPLEAPQYVYRPSSMTAAAIGDRREI